MKRIKSLLKVAGMKFKFLNLQIRFHRNKVSFLVVKAVKCKRGMKQMLISKRKQVNGENKIVCKPHREVQNRKLF